MRSKAYVCGRLIAGIAGSNSAESMDICLPPLSQVVWVVASATGWSLVQSPTGYVNVIVCDPGYSK